MTLIKVVYTTLINYFYIMNRDFPKLEACDPRTCFSGRMMRMDRIISKIFRKHITPFGLTNSQLSILFVTAKKGIVTQQLLSEVLFLEKSSMSRNMRRLLEMELIVRIDSRKIEMTLKGKALLEQIIPEWEKAMTEVNTILGNEGQKAFETVYASITK
ncbi:transcriptional regulator, MarR family protein [Flavobacteriales bacterium ALC-1]|nr:transcriptional regulator, MarR family protein [Flavobacteriales bacterium ALC-1]